MRVLVVHNRYQVAGGEDSVVRQEIAMLQDAGDSVSLFEVNNDDIVGVAAKLSTTMQAAYSWTSLRRARSIIESFQPDVMHVHNFFPRVSPSVYDAAAERSVPVIQTLHNYRMLCANAQLFRDGKVCGDCLGRAIPWPAVRHSCYQGSRAGSAVVAGVFALHRLRGTWRGRVDRYIALTDFARQLYLTQTDIPLEKIVVKPNSSPDARLLAAPSLPEGLQGRFLLYAGRLSPEKGIGVLLEAARSGLSLPLVVAGTGPMLSEVEAAQQRGDLRYVGMQDPATMLALMQNAAALVLPSLWFEGLPVVVAEAFSASLPVIASKIGSLATLIDNERNGLHIEAGSSGSLAAAVRRVDEDCALHLSMRAGARSTYENSFHPAANVAMLRSIYRSAISERATGTEFKSERYSAKAARL